MSLPVITLTSPASKITGAPEIVKTTPFPTSYLDNGAEETFVLKLGVSTQHHHVFHLGKNSTDDREIDVFDAEKYFNEGLNCVPTDDPKNLPSDEKKKLDEPVDEPVVPKVSTLKSTRSETSSTNSRSALLRNHSRKLQPRKSLIRKGFLSSISCSNCSCVGKNSLEIDGSSLDNNSRDHSVKKPGNHQALEPFQKSRANSLTLEKKLNLMSWAGEDIKIPNDNDDNDSDASSDLFEIESISRGKPFFSRQASGRTTCYAPSEASIEWSVVTASAADFSTLSDSEEFRPHASVDKTPRRSDQNHQIINSKTIKEIPKFRPGILSGCKSHKAVGVAGDAHRTRKETTTEYPMSTLTRFRDENGKLGGFSAKIRPQSFDTARVVRSGANAAHLLYT